MNVLWVTNGALPETNALTAKDLPQGGSWLVNMARALSQDRGMSLSIAFPVENATIPRRIEGRSVVYYPFQREATSRARRTHLAAATLRTVMLESNPDLVHIFGTESNLADEAIAVSRSLNIKTIVSIQGLVSYIAEHYFAGIPASVVERRTFRDRLRCDSLNQQRDKFVRRGALEQDLLRRADYVVGRTEWDHACLRLVSPGCQYRVCNETLRESFYASQWTLGEHECFRLFVSQGYYPLKGLHWLLRALPSVIERFPQTTVHVSGPDPLRGTASFSSLRMSSYARYLAELIERLALSDHVTFLGPLDEDGIRRELLSSHAFILPSSIENSSNSLGEALLLGVPSIASFVGGTPDFVEHGRDGFLYQADAFYMLSHYICRIFSDDVLATRLSQAARAKALQIYDAEANASRLRGIYREVANA
jgi:glycosyltransferase involved in cell wall biosynthesis